MPMTDADLIPLLRELAEQWHRCCAFRDAEVLSDSANAIERLTAEVDTLTRALDVSEHGRDSWLAEVERLKAAHEQELIVAFVAGFINDGGWYSPLQIDEALAGFRASRKGQDNV